MWESDHSQPLLPRIKILWMLMATTLIAVALGIVRAAEQGQALSRGLAFTLLFFCAFAGISGVLFLVSYLLGATEKAVQADMQSVDSPFAEGRLPEQIVPPRSVEER